MSDPEQPAGPSAIDARALAAAMLDEQQARASAAADAPRKAMEAQIVQAYPVLSQRFKISATADGTHATATLPKSRSEVRLVPSKQGFVVQMASGGQTHSAASEVALLNALERLDAEKLAAEGRGEPAGPTAPSAARDAGGRFAPPAATPPTGEQPKYRFLGEKDVSW